MSDENKGTGDDSIELSTVVQLSPHTQRDKISTVDREDGKEYISLDETYEVTGQESIAIIAANCREYLSGQRLHRSGFEALMISGVESLMPGYDRYNGIKGGESFIGAIKNGIIVVVKAIKRFVISVVEWIVLRIRTILGFEKTERELQVVAELSDDVKKDLSAVLGNLVGSEKIDLDIAEFYAALPGSVTTTDAFNIIRNRNKTIIDQVEDLQKLQSDLDAAEESILQAGNFARQARSRYQIAIKKLRTAFKDTESFSMSDIIEFRTALDNEIGINLNPVPLRERVAELVDKAYGISLGEVGLDKAFKDNLRKRREELNVLIPVKVDPADYTRIKKVGAALGRLMLRSSHVKFDADALKELKSVIEVEDAELIKNIEAAFPDAGVLSMSYVNYSSSISEYTAALEYLVTISSQIRRSIAGIVNWSNKVDKLMVSYISKDLNSILKNENELLNDKVRGGIQITDANGDVVDSAFNINYDELFIAKHPYIGSALMSYRAKVGELRKQFKVLDRINVGLKKLGISARI